MVNRLSLPLQQFWGQVKKFRNQPSSSLKFSHQEMNQEFIVIGLGRFGTSLAMSLDAHKHSVLAVDCSMERVQQVSQLLPHVIQLDATNVDALREVGIESFDTGVVCIGNNFEANILATVNLRRLGVRRIIAKVMTVTQQDILKKVGANEVVLPEHEAGVRLGRRLASVNFVDFLELSDDTGVFEVVSPSSLVGKSLKEGDIRQQYGIVVIAIRREEEAIISPRAEEVIQEGDILVILGRTVDCERFRQ
jgi:trk system potassium uptake protein TrkA